MIIDNHDFDRDNYTTHYTAFYSIELVRLWVVSLRRVICVALRDDERSEVKRTK